MKWIIIILLFVVGTSTFLTAQNNITNDSPIVGTWNLISPKKSPGPEFIPESYKGMNYFVIKSEGNVSSAGSIFEENAQRRTYEMDFNAHWDGKKLTGEVISTSWTKDVEKLKVSVPMEYDSKKKQIIIHINNPEYGNVKFIYKKAK